MASVMAMPTETTPPSALGEPVDGPAAAVSVVDRSAGRACRPLHVESRCQVGQGEGDPRDPRDGL